MSGFSTDMCMGIFDWIALTRINCATKSAKCLRILLKTMYLSKMVLLDDFAIQKVMNKPVDANFRCYMAIFGEAGDLDETSPTVLEENSLLHTI